MDRIGTSLVLLAFAFVGVKNAAADDLPVPADEFVFCTTCHGVQLMGNPVIKAPRLSGMETWYVEQQLQNFKAGIRGPHEADPYGYEMQPMAAALSDEQIVAVAEFANASRSPAPSGWTPGTMQPPVKLSFGSKSSEPRKAVFSAPSSGSPVTASSIP